MRDARYFVDDVEMTRADKLHGDESHVFSDVKQVIQPIEYRNDNEHSNDFVFLS